MQNCYEELLYCLFLCGPIIGSPVKLTYSTLLAHQY